MPNGNEVQVHCQVSLGFFDSELFVMVGDVSALVNVNSVRTDQGRKPEQGKPIPGLVIAYLVLSEEDRALIELPGQAVVGGLRTWISKDALAAPA